MDIRRGPSELAGPSRFYWSAVRKLRIGSEEARQIVEELSQWKPVDTSPGLIREAWQWMDNAQLSYRDALIVAAAKRSGARYLLSDDLEEGRTFGGVQVLNPFKHPPSDFSWQSARRPQRSREIEC